ncbi:zinc-ribbon domain-containing protein [Chloroflexus aurantiacus]
MGDSPNPIFCASCGHKLTPEDRFCPECGARAPERPSAPAAGAPPTVVLPPAQPGAGASSEEAASPTFCVNCGRKLTPEDRFCPECGTRAPERTPSPAIGAPPTVMIPPEQPPAGAPPTIMIPPEQPPVGVPPVAPPPPQPSVGRTPASYPPPVIPPAQSAGTPPDPFMPPPVTPASYGPPPAGTDPFQVPSNTSPMQTAGTNKWLIWGLVGGSGCLLLILIGICVFIAVSIFAVVDSVPTGSSTEATATTGGGSLASGSSGTVLFSDDFENPQASELGASEDSSSRYAYEAGRYVIEVKEPELLVWALVNGSYRDVIIETSYSTGRGGPVGAAGIIFNYQDEDNFYLFSVSNDGYYALELLENNQWITLIDWTQHEAINPENNRIRVELNGDEITLFVNERQIEQTRDPTFTSGDVGLAVTSFDESGITVSYEEITIRSR